MLLTFNLSKEIETFLILDSLISLGHLDYCLIGLLMIFLDESNELSLMVSITHKYFPVIKAKRY